VTPVVRNLQRRLTMIFDPNNSRRRLSWPALAALAVAAAAVLPLAPSLGGPDAATKPADATPRPAAPKEMSVEALIANTRSCQTCHHGPAQPNKPASSPKPDPKNRDDLHAEIVQLLATMQAQKAALAKTQEALHRALERFEKERGVPKSPDDKQPADEKGRVERLERQLRELRREVEELRRQKKGAAPKQNRMEDANVVTVNTTAFRMPLHVNPERRPTIDSLILYVSSDGGKSYRFVDQVSPDATHFDVDVKEDGRYGFLVEPITAGDKRHPNPARVAGTRPPQTIVVDTKK
jgi:hypothetical protein